MKENSYTENNMLSIAMYYIKKRPGWFTNPGESTTKWKPKLNIKNLNSYSGIILGYQKDHFIYFLKSITVSRK